MLSFILLFIIVAISLNYFSFNSASVADVSGTNVVNLFWRRIVTVLLICTLPLAWESSSTLSWGSSVYLFNGLLVLNSKLNLVVWLLLIAGVTLITITPAGNNANTDSYSYLQKERLIFILCAILGGVILNSATDFLTVLLGLELQSYSVYVLAASYRNYEPSEAAGLKYFLLGALSSALVFMGLAILYAYSGSSNLDNAFVTLSSGLAQSSVIDHTSNYSLLQLVEYNSVLPYVGVVLIFTGISWKVAAAPVQAWSIDVYDAVPTRTTALLSLLPKIALFSFLARIVSLLVSNISVSLPSNSVTTSVIASVGLQLVVLVIMLSLIVGSVAGLFQPRVKRLLAYSSVLNVGFILMGALLNNSNLDLINPLFYIIQYIVTTSAIWLCLVNLGNYNTSENGGNQEITLTSQLQGVHTRTSTYASTTILAVCLTALIFSTAGIPPMVGFAAKLEIILLAIKAGYLSLALIAVAASLISTVYYLGVVRSIWTRSSIFASGPMVSGPTRGYLKSMTTNKLQGSSSTAIVYDYSTLLISFFSLVVVLYYTQYSVVYTFISL